MSDPLCRNALVAWITYLENLSLRESLVEELEKPTNFISENCSGSEDGRCYWLDYVVHTCKKGLEKADFISCSGYMLTGRGMDGCGEG